MGSVAEMKDLSGEKRRVVVSKNYPDKGSVTVVDVKSRKRKTVTNLSYLYVGDEIGSACAQGFSHALFSCAPSRSPHDWVTHVLSVFYLLVGGSPNGIGKLKEKKKKKTR